MKNILWFLHKPTDERERSLYAKAYERSLNFTIILVVTILVLFWLPFADNEANISLSSIPALLWLYLFAVVLIGASAFHNEELEIGQLHTTGAPRISTICLVLGLLILNNVLLVRLFPIPNLFLIVNLATVVLLYVSLCMFAWVSTSQLHQYTRLLLSIFFPVFAIIFVRLKTNRIILRAVNAVVLSSVATILGFIVFAIATFSMGRGLLFYISSDYFAPDLVDGERVYVRSQNDYKTNEYVIYPEEKEDYRFRIAKVKEQENDMVIVENASGTVRVAKKRIKGKIYKDDTTLLGTRLKQLYTSIYSEEFSSE